MFFYLNYIKKTILNTDTSSSTKVWKIVGIVLGAITVIVGIILIIVTIYNQRNKRPWRNKKEKNFYYANDFRKNPGNENRQNTQILGNGDNRLNTENFGDGGSQMSFENPNDNRSRNNVIAYQNQSGNRNTGAQSDIMLPPLSDRVTRQTVLTPRSNSLIEPSQSINGNFVLIIIICIQRCRINISTTLFDAFIFGLS